MAPILSRRLLPLLLLLTTTYCTFAVHPWTAKSTLSSLSKRSAMSQSSSILPPEFVSYNYTQTLDHFNYKPESYSTFQQRYILNSKYWGGANTSSPIFVYTGDEASIIAVASGAGFLVDLASRFQGLLLYIEHRYYGDSMPFGSADQAFRDANTLGFFSSEQALADYAQLITDLKKNLTAENSPVIAIGGSYGGMLASWFRLKYPHMVIGALASSAPILYFDDITPQDGYHVVVSKDFKATSESCYNTIKQSWAEIDLIAAQQNGLTNLSATFITCNPLISSQELKDYLELAYMVSAQYDNPPSNLVGSICNAIDKAPQGTSLLGRVAAGLSASLLGGPCNDIVNVNQLNHQFGWDWQTCTEMVMPIGNNGNNTMFQFSPFDINSFTKACTDTFSIAPRPHWITTEFGGHNIKSVLGNFASNIIFSNGLRDPYSSGGVLQDISDTILAVHTNEGAHCLDLYTPRPTDPGWLVTQRDREIKIIRFWIAEYYARLASQTSNKIG